MSACLVYQSSNFRGYGPLHSFLFNFFVWMMKFWNLMGLMVTIVVIPSLTTKFLGNVLFESFPNVQKMERFSQTVASFWVFFSSSHLKNYVFQNVVSHNIFTVAFLLPTKFIYSRHLLQLSSCMCFWVSSLDYLYHIHISHSLCRVFVGGISPSTTEQDLLELFSQYGTVKATKVINDRAGVSKGYGFVTFETEEEARRLTQEVCGCYVAIC